MTAVLVVMQGPLAGRRIDVEGELVIGREGATLTIDDSELSRRHAAVRVISGGYEVEDLSSLNGTYVNGRRIDGKTRLVGGDAIKLGQTVLELEAARAPATVASATPLAPAPAAAAPAPSEPFGTYAVPITKGRRRGIASRQLGPMLASWAVVAGTAVALAIYFADH